MQKPSNFESRTFPDDGRTPNHPHLPLVVMRRTPAVSERDPAAWFERQFTAHGWGATWRWGVYRFHHFHSANHETLGVSRGNARLMLGGENGAEFVVNMGDVIVLPAGVGHMCIEATDEFEVVGAYPRGEEPDLIRSGEGDLEAARRRIAEVPLPEKDPVSGNDGPLSEAWKLKRAMR